jgi:hypothetical protein
MPFAGCAVAEVPHTTLFKYMHILSCGIFSFSVFFIYGMKDVLRSFGKLMLAAAILIITVNEKKVVISYRAFEVLRLTMQDWRILIHEALWRHLCLKVY